MLSGKILALRSAPGQKISKKKITVPTCSNAVGILNLPLTYIRNTKEPRALRNIAPNTFPI